MLEMISIFTLYHGLIRYLGHGLSCAYSMRTWEKCEIYCFWMKRSNGSNVSFKASVSLLIFCLDDHVSSVLKSPTVTVLLLISPLTVFSICLMYWCAPLLGEYIHIIAVASSWIGPLIIMWDLSMSLVKCFILKSILSYMSFATLTFFWFPFAWSIFFQLLTFSLCVSLGLRWVSCR